MTLGEKLKEVRKRFGLSQENLAEILNVSRQAITKWENDNGLPDISNLQEISKVFGITIDYLVNNETALPVLSLKIELDKEKYGSKVKSYDLILKEYYPEPYEVYTLIREKKKSMTLEVFDFLVGSGTVDMVDSLSDMSPYYLVKKDHMKFLVNIKNWVMEVVELPYDTNDSKFIYKENRFKTCGRIEL